MVAQANVKELKSEPDRQEFIVSFTDFPITTISPRATKSITATVEPEPLVFGIDLGKSPVDALNKTHFNRNLFFWGWIYYRDAFPTTKPHVTEYCFKIGAIDYTFATQSVSFDFQECAEHNCTDENCKDRQQIISAVERPNAPAN